MEGKRSSTEPAIPGAVPYVPVNWDTASSIVGKTLATLEAVMPEGQQLDRTKELVKGQIYEVFDSEFQNQYDYLTDRTPASLDSEIVKYYRAIWSVASERDN